MYKNYVIEIPMENKCHFASNEVELMNSVLDFEPIYKYAIGKNNDCFNAKVYATDEGKLLLGYLVHYSIEDCRAGIDSSNTQMKEIYLLPEGRFVKFYTLMEDNLIEDGQHNRLNRILLVDQSLTDGEIEAIFDHLSFKLQI